MDTDVTSSGKSLFPVFRERERSCVGLPLWPADFVLPAGGFNRLQPVTENVNYSDCATVQCLPTGVRAAGGFNRFQPVTENEKRIVILMVQLFNAGFLCGPLISAHTHIFYQFWLSVYFF